MVKVLIMFYSQYGHVWRAAESIAAGVRAVSGVEVTIRQVADILPDDKLRPEIRGARQQFAHIPLCTHEDLKAADAIMVGCPTSFGNMPASMRAFWDTTAALWAQGALIGKIGAVFICTGTQHGGQETTAMSVIQSLMHHGMLIAGCPYSEPKMANMEEITGGTPYGSTTICGPVGARQMSENERGIFEHHGRFVAQMAKRNFAPK